MEDLIDIVGSANTLEHAFDRLKGRNLKQLNMNGIPITPLRTYSDYQIVKSRIIHFDKSLFNGLLIIEKQKEEYKKEGIQILVPYNSAIGYFTPY